MQDLLYLQPTNLPIDEYELILSLMFIVMNYKYSATVGVNN